MKNFKKALTAGNRMVVNFFLLMMTILLMACGHEEDEGVLAAVVDVPRDSTEQTIITFTFGEITQQAMTRATLQEAAMNDLWLFDYVGGELVNTIHQQSTDDDFGQVSLRADYGEHALYFVASGGTSSVIDGSTVTWAKPGDTFWQNVMLDVQPGMSAVQPVTLQRVATRLRIGITDEVPDGLSTVSVTPDVWYYGLDYKTGAAVQQQHTERAVNIPASYVGTSGQLSIGIYGISGADPWQTDVRLTATGADGSTMSDVTIPDVTLQRNRMTIYSGALFGASKSVSVDVDDTWDEEDAHEW